MEILYIILAFILGAVLAYFILKSSSVSRKSYEELQQNFNQKEADFNKIIAEISAENKAQIQKIAEQQELNERQNSEIKDLQNDKNQLIGLKSQLAAQNESLQQLLDSQKEEIVKIQEEAKLQFENLANKILEEKTLKFTEQNQQNLKNILNPLQEKITDFEKKVENTHKESIDYHAALRQQILGLKEMNLQMSKETLNLTKALKGDSKIQGNWGELVLERVLEKSGLEKGREYEIQKSFTTEEGNRVQPDVIINLPDGKKMIVDSKVSLTAYEKYINEEDDEQKSSFLKEHVNSLKRHVEQLRK
jgi:DNA recombination protein RmuC